jgi:spore germination protein YaaH
MFVLAAEHIPHYAQYYRRSRPLKPKIVVGIVIFAILIGAIIFPHRKPPHKIKTPEKPAVHPLMMMAFFENGWGGVYGDSFPVLKENYPFVDVISPFWYSVDDAGQIRVNRSRLEVLDFAKSKDIPVIPLVTNWQGSGGRFLTSEPARQNSLANLVNLSRNYPGLNLDVEFLPASYREPLVQYIQSLHTLLAQEKKQLLVCAYPQVDFPQSRSALHDYPGLAAACDGLILMAYDYHRPNTASGPVAPLPWVEANIQYALKAVPPDKLWLGIPGYGYRWQGQAKTEAIPAWKAEQDARELKIPVQWDPTSQTPFYTWDTNHNGGVVWYEDKRSTGEKIKLARKYRLKGLALWRMGYEVKGFWSSLSSAGGSNF